MSGTSKYSNEYFCNYPAATNDQAFQLLSDRITAEVQQMRSDVREDIADMRRDINKLLRNGIISGIKSRILRLEIAIPAMFIIGWISCWLGVPVKELILRLIGG